MTFAPRWIRRALALGLLATGVFALGEQSRAQAPSELDVKVALLYNFAKFVEWPPDALPPSAPLNLCVLGDQPLRSALGAAIKGRVISGHDLTASDVAIDGSLDRCQVLYARGMDASAVRTLVKAAAGLPVFTVSDFDRFAELGGVANFFREGDRTRIAVNVEAARRSRLQISSKLLALATIVKPGKL